MTEAQLTIGTGRAVKWPLDAITRTFAVLGQRGSGKTSAAVVMVEEMVRNGGHAAVLDPVGVWWGITRAGRQKGLPGIVIGGEHGDIPLEEGAGQLVADLVVGRHWPLVVIDMKLLRKGAQLRFMADYLEALYHSNREPLHQVFEEADRPLPQGRVLDPHAARCLGAGEDIVKLGRSRGLGATVVTQRPATLNKNVLEVCESLLAFRVMGPNDRKAIRGWIEANGDTSKTATVMDSMAQLKLGECWVWSPSFVGTLQRIKVRPRGTFDSSFTPKVGERVPDDETKRAPVDLDELRERMAETVERQKQKDPVALRKRISELEAELALTEEPEPERVEVLVPDEEATALFAEAVGELVRFCGDMAEVAQAITEIRGEAESLAAKATERLGALRAIDSELPVPAERPPASPPAPTAAEPRPAPPRTPAMGAPRPSPAPSDNGALTKGERGLLQVLARHHPMRLRQTQLATLAKRGKRSSTLDAQLGRLAKRGYIERGSGDIAATQRGLDEVGHVPQQLDPVQTWRQALPDGLREMLDVMLGERRPMSKEEIATGAGVSATSSTTDDKLATLKANGLIVSPQRGIYELSDLLV